MKKIEADVVIDTNAVDWAYDNLEGFCPDVFAKWKSENLNYGASCLDGEDFARVYKGAMDDIDYAWKDCFDFDAVSRDMTKGVVEQMTKDGVELTDVGICDADGSICAHAEIDEDKLKELLDEYDYYLDDDVRGKVNSENMSDFLTLAYSYEDYKSPDWQDKLIHDSLMNNVREQATKKKLTFSSWCGSIEESDLVEKAKEIAEGNGMDWVDVFEEIFPDAYETYRSVEAESGTEY